MVLLTVIGVLGMTTQAWAHAVLESSSPAQGASLSAPPAEVTLTFGEAVTLPRSPVMVVGPGGVLWQLGDPKIAGPVVTVPVISATGPAGAYMLTYRVISDDGDGVSGTIRFTLTTAAGGSNPTAAQTATPSTDFVAGAAPVSAPAGSHGVPVWVWVLVAAVVVIGAGVLVNRSRRS
jgi:hypothetical protein